MTFCQMLGTGDMFESLPLDSGSERVIVKLLFVLYLLMSIVVLLNLLIAMMNNTYTEAVEIAERQVDANTLLHLGYLLMFERRFTGRLTTKKLKCLKIKQLKPNKIKDSNSKGDDGSESDCDNISRWYMPEPKSKRKSTIQELRDTSTHGAAHHDIVVDLQNAYKRPSPQASTSDNAQTEKPQDVTDGKITARNSMHDKSELETLKSDLQFVQDQNRALLRGVLRLVNPTPA
jgi:hypothetical protein